MRQWLWILSFLLFAPKLWAQQYHFKTYSVREGVPQSQVYALLQDSRGYLWLGTRGGGLARYDGREFVTFNQRNGLKDAYIHALTEDANGNLWVATNQGLASFNGERFTWYQPGSDSVQWTIFDLCFDGKGRLWLATIQGLRLFENDRFSAIKGLKPEIVYTVKADTAGLVWYGGANGMGQIDARQKEMSHTRLPRLRKGLSTTIQALWVENEQKIWIGTYGAGLYLWNGKSYSRPSEEDLLSKENIFSLLKTNGKLWIATMENGIGILDEKSRQVQWLGEREGLANNHARCILRDRNGNYWIGTSGAGVSNYFGQQFTLYDKDDGLAGNYIYSIARDAKGRLLIGHSAEGFSREDSIGYRVFSAKTGFMDVKVKAMAPLSNGKVLIGTEGSGLFLLDDTLLTELPAMKNKLIRSILTVNDSLFYVATAGHGVFEYSQSDLHWQYKQFGKKEGLSSLRINHLHLDTLKRLWMASEKGDLQYLLNSEIFTIETVSKNMVKVAIRSLAEDDQGYLWMGTAGQGLFSLPLYANGDKTMRQYGLTEGLHSNNIYLLASDKRGRLIAGSEAGLDLIWLNGREWKEIKHYGNNQGFTGVETCQNAVWLDANGTGWFGTINGLVRYVPALNKSNAAPPQLLLKSVKIFYNPIQSTPYASDISSWGVPGFAQLPHHQNHVTFDFQGINLSNPDGVQYSWMLVGQEDSWSPFSYQQSVTYSSLPAGDFVFLLRAKNEEGVITPKPLKYRFKVLPPWWKTWPALFIAILVLAAVIALLFTWRLNLARQKHAEREAQLRLENELLELQQKTLRLQMNPHFIFNALNSIQSLIGSDQEQQARYFLAKFARLMRQILDYSRAGTISLAQELTLLENYLLVEKFCQGNRFDYSLQVAEGLDVSEVSIPPMLLQPFIENAIKHGLKTMNDRRGLILVKIEKQGHYLNCSVTDNGIGREKAKELKAGSLEPEHRGMALEITAARLESLMPQASQHPVEIIDLYQADGQAAGTKVIVKIPYFESNL